MKYFIVEYDEIRGQFNSLKEAQVWLSLMQPINDEIAIYALSIEQLREHGELVRYT